MIVRVEIEIESEAKEGIVGMVSAHYVALMLQVAAEIFRDREKLLKEGQYPESGQDSGYLFTVSYHKSK